LENLAAIARTLPVRLLHLSLNGEFREEVERILERLTPDGLKAFGPDIDGVRERPYDFSVKADDFPTRKCPWPGSACGR